MTKQQENRAFVKMLKEFPKAFGRVSFRERLMLRTAFTYVVEEVIADIKANCDFALEGKDVEIKELKDHLVEEVELHLHAEEYIKSLERENAELKSANQTLATMNNDMWVELEKKRAESQGITNRLHQLIKAKEIIKKFTEFVNNEIEYDPEHPQEHTDKWNELCKQTEQFIKEIEE